MGTQPAEPNVLRSIWAHRVLVASIAALFAALGVAFYLSRPITYAAEAGALLQDPRSTIDSRGNTSRGDAVRYVADQVAVMKSDEVLQRASARMQSLKGITPLTTGELQHAMTVQTDQGSSYVVVKVEADDPVSAKYAADSVIYAYRTTTRLDVAAQTRAAERKLDQAIAAVAQLMSRPNRTAAQQSTALALIQQLRGRRNRIEVNGQLAGDGVALFSPAKDGKRQGVPLLASMLIGLVLGGLIGCGAAYVIETLSTRDRGRGRVTPVAAAVPDARQPAADGNAPTPLAADDGAEPIARKGRRWA